MGVDRRELALSRDLRKIRRRLLFAKWLSSLVGRVPGECVAALSSVVRLLEAEV